MSLNIFIKLLAFAYFFALASHVHLTDLFLTYSIIQACSFLLCFIVILSKKTSKILFFTFLSSIIIEFAYNLPYSPNHRFVLFFLALLLFLSFGKENSFQKRTLPAIRWLTIIVYIFAFFAKLNSSYLDPNKSCSVLFYKNILETFSFFPSGQYIDYFIIYSSILIELYLPLLLIIRPGWGLLLGILFHTGLALDIYKYFINFSSVMYVCLGSFLAKEASNKFLIDSIKQTFILKPFFIISLFIVLASELYSEFIPLEDFTPFLMTKFIVWFGIASYLVFSTLMILIKSGINYKLCNKLFFPEIIVISIVILNGLSPYLGIKTRTSFNMYSNMVMTSKSSNHLIVPKSLDIFNYLENIENGKGTPSGFLEERFLLFRDIKKEESGKCVW